MNDLPQDVRRELHIYAYGGRQRSRWSDESALKGAPAFVHPFEISFDKPHGILHLIPPFSDLL
jgi:hypothetical protein